MPEQDVIRATGRRKCASAQVRLRPGEGRITVNGRQFEDYFTTEPLRAMVVQPLLVTDTFGKVDIDFNVRSGGLAGQAHAARHALARALQKETEELRPVLKKSGFLTRDSREKERKKMGQPGARKRFQFSKR